MKAETLVVIGGVYHLLIAVGHVFLPRVLRWKEDLSSLTSLNRAVVQILNISLTLAFLVFSYLSLFHARELVGTLLGCRLLLLLGLFWYLRAVQQVLFMGLRKGFSIVLTAVFIAAGTLYALALLSAGGPG